MYFYGGDYNPEQWSDQVRAEDLTLMRRAGVNLATVGVFSWSALEPQPGRYDFGWLDRVLDDLHAAGVGVALATPTASPPPWFTVAHPDALAQTREGVRLVHGSRDTYCVNAPAYRAASEAIAARLAERFGQHPALTMWHVHNEYGTWCFCDHCASAFRDWLRARHGDLTGLNEAWGTEFWGQRYGDWAQVLPPRATQYLHSPGHQLDYRRFMSDSLLAAYTSQRDLLRAASPGTPVTTNFVLGGWVPVDHARWAAEVDLVAIDHYPTTLDDAAAQSAFAADAARGWADAAGHADGEWLLMEHAAGSVTEQGIQRRKPPGTMARLALGHLARGSRGALYFQWRASRAGAEQWHSALVPHAGPDSRIFAEAVELGARLPALPQQPAGINPKIAIWYDEQCSWALQASHLPAPVDYQQTVERWHQALWRRGYPLDVVPPEADLTPYQLVVVPVAYLLGAGAADRLARFVAGGGHLLVGYLSGLVDENAQVGLGGYPALLRELLGIRVEEFDPLTSGRTQQLSTAAGEPYATATGWTERLRALDARVDAHYPDGSAAVTSRAHGAGLARYLSCDLVPESLDQLLVAECAAAGIAPVLPGLPDGVEAIRSRGALWLINHTDRPQLVAGHALAAGAVDVLPND